MSKVIVKIELDGKRIGSKPLFMSDSLTAIREKIKEKTDVHYVFLDQDGIPVEEGDENDYTLENIEVNKIIKIKKMKGDGIDILLNNKEICSLKIEKGEKLDKARIELENKIKVDFLFLDTDENPIEKEDEKDFSIEDCLINEKIKLKSEINESAPTPTPVTKQATTNKFIYRKKKAINFSNYEILIKTDDCTIYRYSKIERTSPHELVYQYYYDKIEPKDYDNAYVILFCGKSGDGKTTAINSFFNIVKGVELNDNYRFILIKEVKKEKGQAESQTDGVHLYYVRDQDNKPLIIIDSQGYGDTRGTLYDQKINDAFKYVFSNVIDHINTVAFISKSNNNRIDILTKYIFSCVTSLFSEDISENFIILATYANDETLTSGPDFVESIQTHDDFLKIQKRMDKNWWYAFDSKCLLKKKETDLSKYSYKSMLNFYKEKVLSLRPKSIKKCAEILEIRKEYRIQVNNLTGEFQNLIVEQKNLEEKIKTIVQIDLKIKKMEENISNLEKDMANLKPEEAESKLKELNKELKAKLFELNNEVELTKYKGLVSYDNLCTFCESCERNCHDICDCRFSSLGRCKVFTFWERKCEECGCEKKKHKQDYYHYEYKYVETKKDTNKEQEEERQKNEQKKKKILEEINKKEKDQKNNIKKQKDILEKNKVKLEDQKKKCLKERISFSENINQINKNIIVVIYKLQSYYQKINDIAMNNNFMKTEDEYIDSLKSNIEQIGYEDSEQIKILNKIKEDNKIFQEAIKLKKDDLINLNDSQLIEQLNSVFEKKRI